MQDFLPEHTPILKAAMRPRAPGCYFQPEDVAAVAAATGLNDAQIKKWAANTRARYTKEERETYLHVEDAAGRKETEQSSRVYRFRWSAYNVDEDFLRRRFTMPKARGAGEFGIRYMAAAIAPLSRSADVFIEFNEQVWLHKLRERLEELGAGSVHIDVFGYNDVDESASSGLLGVWLAAKAKEDKGGSSATGAPCLISIGSCAPALLAKTNAKLELHERTENAFDAKTQDGIKYSIECMREQINTQGAIVVDKLDAQSTQVNDKLDACSTEVRDLRTVVTERSAGERRLLELLNDALATIKAKTLLADRVEQSKGVVTHKLNTALAATESAEKKARRAQRTADALAQTNATVTSQLADAHNTIAVLRAHLATCSTQNDAVRELVETCNARMGMSDPASKKRREHPSEGADDVDAE